MRADRIVESAEAVINNLGSLGCHVQEVSSPTCPLFVGASNNSTASKKTMNSRGILHITNVRIPLDKSSPCSQVLILSPIRRINHTYFSSPSLSNSLAWHVPEITRNWDPSFENFKS